MREMRLGGFGMCWHRWGKWSDPTNGIYAPFGASGQDGVGYFAVAQIRICKKCGVARFRTLPKVRSLESLKEEG